MRHASAMNYYQGVIDVYLFNRHRWNDTLICTAVRIRTLVHAMFDVLSVTVYTYYTKCTAVHSIAVYPAVQQHIEQYIAVVPQYTYISSNHKYSIPLSISLYS